MAAISQTINNVLGGVSQQPDPVMLPGQVNEAINTYLDPTFGCSKRPGTQYIGLLASDIPDNAKWFPIFRDGKERYVGAIYRDNGVATIRVWNADTAEESTVTLLGDSGSYLEVNDPFNIETLTVNDYTFIINTEKVVTMDTRTSPSDNNKALLVINQVAYNTTYAVDFLRDGDELQQVKIQRATKLSVTPSSWEVKEVEEEDQGSCAFAQTANFVEDAGDATGLGFKLTTTCNPTLVNNEVEGALYPTSVAYTSSSRDGDYGLQAYAVQTLGRYANDYALGSYVYLSFTKNFGGNRSVSVRVELRVSDAPFTTEEGQHVYRVSRAEITDYDDGDNGPFNWTAGTKVSDVISLPSGFSTRPNNAPVPNGSTASLDLNIDSVRRAEPSIEVSYKSAYRTNVVLNNGGEDWSVGDTVSVTMQGKDYTVKVEEVEEFFGYASESSVSYTTAADTASGVLDVNSITSNLVSSINALPNYSAAPVGNVVIIERTDGRDFNLQTRGGTADQALSGIKQTVNDISRLPAQCENGFSLKVSNSDQSDADDYYVKFKTEGDIPGQGSWEETVKPGVTTDLAASTMPHVLERDSAGNFSIRPLTKEFDEDNFWAPRAAGDAKTNPQPTFVGKTIQDAVFYMNRLGFMSGETIVMSQAGDYFNFFQGSSIAISDADPIDMSVSTTRPAKLKAALAVKEGLLMFAENSQFMMTSQDTAFGPATARIVEVGDYAYRSKVKPIPTSVSIMFPTSADTFSKVFEMANQGIVDNAQVTENTRIIPSYIPPDLTHLTAAPNSSLALMGIGDETVYVFKYFNSGTERQMAGWCKWQFADKVRMIEFDHDTGFFVQRQEDTGNYTLSRMELLDDPERSPIDAFDRKFSARLDNYMYSQDLTVEAYGTSGSRVRLPDGLARPDSDFYLLVTVSGQETFYETATVYTDATGDYVDFPNTDYRYQDFTVGNGYNMEIRLPGFFVKEGERNMADRRYPPMVSDLYLELYLSGRYTLDIKKVGYQDRTIDLDMPLADLYNSNTAAMDLHSTRQLPIYCRGDLVSVTINVPDPLPASLTSYSWEGSYSTRGIARR